MRYMLLICTDPTAEPEAPGDLPIDDWVAETDGSGERIGPEHLARVAATWRRYREGMA